MSVTLVSHLTDVDSATDTSAEQEIYPVLAAALDSLFASGLTGR